MLTHTKKTDQILSSQLELFERRLPRTLYCADDFKHGVEIRRKKWALRRKHIQVNPPWLKSFLVFDIDRDGAALAWEDEALPEPIWTSTNKVNGHAHLAYSLNAPVLLGQHDRKHPMRYLTAVESALRDKLRADVNYGGLITKNPLHPHWRTAWGFAEGYDLGYLSEFLDLNKHKPYARVKPETIGLGRNCDSFDHLRHYAYKEVRLWRDSDIPPPGHDERRGVYVHWLTHLYQRGLKQTNDEHPQSPLDHREVHHIAKSVANWVWNRFDIQASDERFSRRQSLRGIRSGKARRLASEDNRASAVLMKASGMSYRAIARELEVSEGAVRYWFRKS